ncbi:ribose 5-phosphate isomerase A [Deinococcus cavernae]|uniref:Ribose-5-phosphate isomerase A n=1 Tax=Deinococcus cavernae TaxID=2320857 RepID=A0A418V4W5_9DEIO|nr:ribose 5-phosphate isomerase A [Deinococcus cavernae]RJF71153.1 ribose 5-phosphate isomerase A [Deinococcus cavernae]
MSDPTPLNLETLKKEAALRAVELVQSGDRVGLGTGSTAKYAIEEIGRRLKSGELTGIVGVSTSEASEKLAREVGIPTETLDPRPLDIAIDGADEIAPNLDLVKGLGGALVREKVTEVQARRLIIIADHTKIVGTLGEKAPLPIEILKFGFLSTIERLRDFLPGGRLRQPGAQPYETDNGNYIYDAQLPRDFNPVELERRIKGTLGVVDTGFFLGMAERAFVAAPDGVRELTRD